jgi:esterase/lipase superfamily enzyme
MNLPSIRDREISVRTDPKKGGLRDTISKPLMPPHGEHMMIIFIHGFNVNEPQGRASYNNFIESLMELRVCPVYKKKIWQFFWPGNKANPLFSALSYSAQVPTARHAASMLSSYLDEICLQSPLTQFYFIAHSLGCRLTIEALKSIAPQNASRVRLVALMAAAIPSYMIEDKTLGVPPDTRVTGLYSSCDRILQLCFPLGQTLAREGITPSAIGFTGKPADFWTADSRDTGLGHSEYWTDYQVARFLANKMKILTRRDTPMRFLSKRRTPSYKNGELEL